MKKRALTARFFAVRPANERIYAPGPGWIALKNPSGRVKSRSGAINPPPAAAKNLTERNRPTIVRSTWAGSSH